MSKQFDVQAWLTEVGSDGQPRHRRLCWLGVAAGTWHPTNYGSIAWIDGHQYGLEINNFFELREVAAYMCGLRDAGVPIFEALDVYLKAYVIECGVPVEYLVANEGGNLCFQQ